ncbi:MAG: demethoxyubiquinone hydroxylase family protein [Pseudomonadota bacterium]
MGYLPGDKKHSKNIEQIIRVNHAGEYGAKRIYQGQLDVLKDDSDQALLKHMAEQEEEHLGYFTKEMQQRRIRPTLLMPIWHILGYALGACTAKLGKNSAMIATEAVEEVIDKHYQEQLKTLETEKDLAENIEKFRLEEVEHHDIAKKNMTKLNLGHKLLYNFIKLGCKLSIAITKKI